MHLGDVAVEGGAGNAWRPSSIFWCVLSIEESSTWRSIYSRRFFGPGVTLHIGALCLILQEATFAWERKLFNFSFLIRFF